jgi:hypothetical protein
MKLEGSVYYFVQLNCFCVFITMTLHHIKEYNTIKCIKSYRKKYSTNGMSTVSIPVCIPQEKTGWFYYKAIHGKRFIRNTSACLVNLSDQNTFWTCNTFWWLPAEHQCHVCTGNCMCQNSGSSEMKLYPFQFAFCYQGMLTHL